MHEANAATLTQRKVILRVSFVLKEKRMISHQSLDDASRLDGRFELKRAGRGRANVPRLHVIADVPQIDHRRRTISFGLQERHLSTHKHAYTTYRETMWTCGM